MTKLTVATINLHNRQDRWFQRRHLLVGQLIDAAPDLISLQEIDFTIAQGLWLRRQINARLGRDNKRPYQLIQTRKRHLIEGYRQGIGILTRLPVIYYDVLNLGYGGQPALRINIRLPDNQSLDFVSAQLESGPNAPGARHEQVMLLAGWLRDKKWVPYQIVAGDFNDRPKSEAIIYMKQQFLSAFELCYKQEPLATFPTALVEPIPPPNSAWHWGWANCLDYIFVSPAIKKVTEAKIFLDKPSDEDDTLYPSDHVGLMAKVDV